MNTAHVIASFYLLFNTGLSQEEFEMKYNKDVLINSKVEVTLPDGTIHSASLSDMLESSLVEFETNEDKEKVTENGTLSDQITPKQ